MGKEKEVCSWCGKELHDNGETTWCDCGWWDALPTRAEAEAETEQTIVRIIEESEMPQEYGINWSLN